MIIGTNKETKNSEFRVALLPSGVAAFVARGHEVLLERGAGAGAGFADAEYEAAGAELVDGGETVFERADLVYKVKEPMDWEYELMRPDQTLFTYIHSAGNRPLCDALLKTGILGVAFEDVELSNGRLPLLEPMSTIAGYMGMWKGFEMLHALSGGPGILPAGMPGCRPCKVMILGAGFVGQGALQLAAGVGAEVTVLDIDVDVLAQTKTDYPAVRTLFSNPDNIASCVAEVDIVLNAVMWPKSKKGHLVSRAMLGTLQPGAVIVDVSADIHGGIETCERQTTHDDPIYKVDGVPHYVVANIPSLAARTASEALANVTLPYALKLADRGVAAALLADENLRRGVTCQGGGMVRAITADWYGCQALTDKQLVERLRQ